MSRSGGLLTSHDTFEGALGGKIKSSRGPYGIKPYVEMRLWNEYVPERRPGAGDLPNGAENVIAKVVVGPGQYAEERVQAVRSLMRSAGVFPGDDFDSKVTKSRSSLRG